MNTKRPGGGDNGYIKSGGERPFEFGAVDDRKGGHVIGCHYGYTVEYSTVIYPDPATAAVDVAVRTISNEHPLEKYIPIGLKLASINGFETSPPPVREVELDCIPRGRIPRTLEFIVTFDVVLLYSLRSAGIVAPMPPVEVVNPVNKWSVPGAELILLIVLPVMKLGAKDDDPCQRSMLTVPDEAETTGTIFPVVSCAMGPNDVVTVVVPPLVVTIRTGT